MKKNTGLKKELRLFNVFALATGATLSAGFFLLPGLAAQEAGPAVILAYLLAAVPLIPAMLSIVELCTAMPRAGGVYYFLDRALGPLFGTIGGFGTWLALILKVSFALVGMGYYISVFFSDHLSQNEIKAIASSCAIFLGLINLFDSKKSGSFQSILVISLLVLLGTFLLGGAFKIEPSHFEGFFSKGPHSIAATAGLVYISYVGVTKVASLSEEVKDPERNLPTGIFLSLIVALLIYGLGTTVMVGVLPLSQLQQSLTPVAEVSRIIFGESGAILLSIAAIIAFTSVANAGTLSASRYPLAMSRDYILPSLFRKVNKQGSPYFSTFVTSLLLVLLILFLEPIKIAKLASAFQLLIFSLVCLSVIIMRESKIPSYDPGYKSPLYPWTQIVGAISPLWLIYMMGPLPSLFSLALITLGTLWYFIYARKRVYRSGAIFHIFERLGQLRYDGLDRELRGILKEKGLRTQDPFDEIVAHSLVIDCKEGKNFEDLVAEVSHYFAEHIDHTAEEIEKRFLDGTGLGETPVTEEVALPHFHTDGLDHSIMVMVRSLSGIAIHYQNPLEEKMETSIVHALFFLISPKGNPTLHLRILAQIAGHVEEESFSANWKNAKDEQELKEVLLRDEHCISLYVLSGTRSEEFVGQALKDVKIPEQCLVALLRRKGEVLIPRGQTQFQEGDRITIIGDAEGIKTLRQRYSLNTLLA